MRPATRSSPARAAPSSYAFDGAPGFGVARTTDGGATWTLSSGSTFNGRIISSVVATSITSGGVSGEDVLAADLFGGGGVYRSTNGGTTFTQVSGTGGMPTGGVSSLAVDPNSSTGRVYAGLPESAGGGSNAGVYRSDDDGVTWTATASLSGVSSSSRILLSVSQTTSVVYAMEINTSGTLTAVFRSDNEGAAWTSMGQPSPTIYPGFQSIVHGASSRIPPTPTSFSSRATGRSPVPQRQRGHRFHCQRFPRRVLSDGPSGRTSS